MKKYFLFGFLFLCLGLTSRLVGQGRDIPCNAQPPSNVTIIEKGATYVSLKWNSVYLAVSYNIRVYNDTDSLVSESNTIDTFITIVNLLPNSSYRIKVSSNCINGSTGNRSSDIDIITLILVDLIAENTNLGPVGSPCEQVFLMEDVKCKINISSPNLIMGEIVKNDDGRLLRFGIRVNINQGIHNIQVWLIDPINYQNIAFSQIRLTSNLNQETGIMIEYIKVAISSVIGVFGLLSFERINESEYYVNFNPVYLTKFGTENPFTFRIYSAVIISGGSNDSDRFSVLNTISPTPSILPNPTTTTLQIQIPQTFTSPIQGTLLNLSGAVVQRYGLEAGVNTVSTTNLSPGIYFLRLEGPGYAETFKVVKVE